MCNYICIYAYHIISSLTVHDAHIHTPILTKYLEDQRARSFLSGIILLAYAKPKSNMSKASTCHEWPQENSTFCAVNYLDLRRSSEKLCVSPSSTVGLKFWAILGTFDFRSYTTHQTFTAREASSAYLQAPGIGGTKWDPCDFRSERSSPGESM